MNSALKTRNLWDLNPSRHSKCIAKEIWGRACEINRTNQPLISYLILFVRIYHIFCAFSCLKYPFKYLQTPLYGHPLNPLSPNIQVQILQSDLHTFPLRISWENLMKDQGIFSLVIILLILLTLPLENGWIMLGENWCWSLIIQKPYYYRQFALSLGKESPYISVKSTHLIWTFSLAPPVSVLTEFDSTISTFFNPSMFT